MISDILRIAKAFASVLEPLHPQRTYASNDPLPTFIQYCTVLLIRWIDLMYEHAVDTGPRP